MHIRPRLIFLVAAFSLLTHAAALAGEIDSRTLWRLHPAAWEHVERQAAQAAIGLERKEGAALVQAVRLAGKKRERMRTDIKVIFYFSPTCGWCEKQKREVAAFVAAWGWNPFSLVDTSTHPEAAQAAGITAVPRMVAKIRLQDGVHDVDMGQGVRSAQEIEQAIMELSAQWR